MVVNINTDRNTYKLRWSYLGKRYSLSIGTISKASLKAAEAKAKLIESDILFDRFDTTLAKYDPTKHIQHTEQNLLGIWERYKQLNAKRIALTTQKEVWTQVDRCLTKIPPGKAWLLSLDKADELVNELLKYYSPETLRRVLISLNAANEGKYYKLNKLPKANKSAVECFSDREIKAIIEAFETNKFQSVYSDYAHDYYANYVRFLAYTFCRPEEAIALTWQDINWSDKLVRFNKAYSKGILKNTKTNKVRDFPINEQLASLLVEQIGKHNLLVFPSVSNKHINHRTWHKRYWKPIVTQLANESTIAKYLKPYCLRHSGITRCIRAGLDIATVANLAGTSTEMILRSYLAPSKLSEINLPLV